MQTRTSDSIELAVMRTLCKRFRTDFAKRIGNLTPASGSYLALDIDPSAYTDPSLFSKDFLLYSLLRKWKGWRTGIDTEQAAIDSWTAAERLNAANNIRLLDTDFPEWALSFFAKVQRKIVKVIGDAPDFAVLDPLCKWGPGTTFDIRKGDGTDPASKMSCCISVTKRALPHLHRVMDAYWVCAAGDFGLNDVVTVVEGNRAMTVPKNAKTDRMISAEPTGNSFLQQGVGRYLRKRLLAFGVNLSDQSINQKLAFAAYVDDLSTIDLSMASDTLCFILVSLLLPPAWFSYLCDLRSPKTQLNGKWYAVEKFASMGNAFTFELESLIFWAISSVVSGERGSVSVYGDDIIVPRSAYDDVVGALRYCGFTPNTEKSYRDGCFFESCGGQYHSLEDVTPAYQKEVVGENLDELIRMHNRIYRWGLTNGMHLVRDALADILAFTKRAHPKLERLPRTPMCEEDAGFITPLPHPDIKVNRNGDFRCFVLTSTPILLHGFDNREMLAALSYKLRHFGSENVLPDGTYGVRVGQRSRLGNRLIWRSSCKS